MQGQDAAAFSIINSSKESEDFIEQKNMKNTMLEFGGMTQEHFYKVPADISPWKPGDHSGS